MQHLSDKPLAFHDPTIVEGEDGYFYCFSTDTNIQGVQISRSTNLIDWTLLKTAFSKRPEEVERHVKQPGFWAPEIVKVDQAYRLYCCSSYFGTSQSVIGLATSPSLTEDFVYQGDVLRSYHTGLYDAPNAIDPNLVRDADGQYYLVYGSFFGGIFIAKLDDEGFIAEQGYGQRLIGGHHTAVEGAYIHYDESRKRYYLFASFGSLTYDYHIRVGSSQSIMGPYLDSRGLDMANLDPIHRVGDKIAGSYQFDLAAFQGWMGPGHNSILMLSGSPHVVHHVRRIKQMSPSYMQIRKVYFSSKDQIYLSPVPMDEYEIQVVSQLTDRCQFNTICFDRYNDGIVYGRNLELEHVQFEDLDSGRVSFSLEGTSYEGHLFKHKQDIYLTAISEHGDCVWAVSHDAAGSQ